jgi:hypothetical protein
MNATKLPRRKTARKSLPIRPVTELLLELAYHLHATRVVARLDKPEPRRSAPARSL